MSEKKPLEVLLNTLPQTGRVEWIGIRPSRKEAMITLEAVMIQRGKGLEGDRFKGRSGSSRQVTLIQQEHLTVIASCLGLESVEPELLRRNIVVSGINLLALKKKIFHVGDAILEISGLFHP